MAALFRFGPIWVERAEARRFPLCSPAKLRCRRRRMWKSQILCQARLSGFLDQRTMLLLLVFIGINQFLGLREHSAKKSCRVDSTLAIYERDDDAATRSIRRDDPGIGMRVHATFLCIKPSLVCPLAAKCHTDRNSHRE